MNDNNTTLVNKNLKNNISRHFEKNQNYILL